MLTARSVNRPVAAVRDRLHQLIDALLATTCQRGRPRAVAARPFEDLLHERGADLVEEVSGAHQNTRSRQARWPPSGFEHGD